MYHTFRDELNNLKNSTNYVLGKPWRNDKKSQAYVIPILKGKVEKRGYVMLDELKANKDYIINDTGQIDSLTVENKIKTPIFIRTGAMLKGPTQNRAVIHSIIVAPGEKANINSRCIHASSPISSDAYMSGSCGYVPEEVHKSLRKGQGETWSSVTAFASNTCGVADFSLSLNRRRVEGASVPIETYSDDLAGTTDVAYKALKDSPCYPSQVGIIIVDTRGIRALELYDAYDSWSALHKRVLEKYKTVLTNQADTDIFKLDMKRLKKKLPEFIDTILHSKEDTVESSRLFNTRYLDNVDGEYSVIRTNGKHKFVHVIASNKELYDKTDSVRETYSIMY